MHTFRNTVLLVVFNYADNIGNMEAIEQIYGQHFKKIIYYSDLPNQPCEAENNINFLDIGRGYYVHRIFKHFYDNYENLLKQSDGFFYTMDDNIINVNILNLLSNKKIIYYHREVHSLAVYSEWHWDQPWGKAAISVLESDQEFKKYNIEKFSGIFADWFYLPQKYLTKDLFELFCLFGKYNVFLEIAIPSVIHNIEKDPTQYQHFSEEVLWLDERVRLNNKQYLFDSLNKKHNLIIHPIKLGQNPDAKSWLKDFFCKKKCVIITTINKPTFAIVKHLNNIDYDVIIVGDNKTPDDYENLNCIYLSIDSQKKLFPELSELIPYNHYCRKNLGYLYAIKKGYEIIYETDDDNIPNDNFDKILDYSNLEKITEAGNRWINIFKYFTNNSYIWPRGYPLSQLKNQPNFLIEKTDLKPSIINGLVEGDPDVDALFRIICNHQDTIIWQKNLNVIIDNNNVCVFNSQNTFWLNKNLFMCLLIPTSVSFRFCDILRGLIANIVLAKTNNYMMYSSPNVVQIRNEHDLISDFKSEYEMYIHNESIMDFIENGLVSGDNVKNLLISIYKNLFDNNVIEQSDLVMLEKWIEYFH